MNEIKHCHWPISIKYLLLINAIDYSAIVSGQVFIFVSCYLVESRQIEWIWQVPILILNDCIDIIQISKAISHAGHQPDFPLAHM